MAEVIKKLVRKRRKRLLVSFDWTEFRDFHTLMAAACIKGRSVPLLCPDVGVRPAFSGRGGQTSFLVFFLL
jgi:hypothetical protein